MLRDALRRHLLRSADLRRYLDHRVFYGTAPQDTPTPYLTFNLVSRPPHSPDLTGEGNLRKQIWQFDVWIERADDPTGAKMTALDRALERQLMDFAGVMEDVAVHCVDYMGGGDAALRPNDGRDNTLNRLMQEYAIEFEV